ncbi:hypothetical protein QCA50_018641 [Cerrena zonata]|uniref:Uncharacterized protein n=1 Tax=Cerrena zonata TaxID=2478898 RepID=A0AAW0FAJ4_9APHY
MADQENTEDGLSVTHLLCSSGENTDYSCEYCRYSIEGHVAWRVLYRMWRLDEAARAFKMVLDRTEDFKKALVYKRWEIGLTIETENLEKALAHMCLRGLMTTRLSKAIDARFRWLHIDEYPPVIDWTQLPDPNAPSMGNLSELFDGTVPQIAQGESYWWTYDENTDAIEQKPHWWDEPEKEVCTPFNPVASIIDVM